MTFGQWFKKHYPANESAYVKEVARRAWNAAVEACVQAANKVPLR